MKLIHCDYLDKCALIQNCIIHVTTQRSEALAEATEVCHTVALTQPEMLL